MAKTNSTLVIGHRNPDTDAIASAVGYAWVLNKLAQKQQDKPTEVYTAGRTGKVNAQTAFALERFGLQPPELVADVWARVSDLAQPVKHLNKGQNLLEACQLVAQTRRPAPVLDEHLKPIGLLSGAVLFGRLADALSSASVLALAHEFQVSAESSLEGTGTTFNSDEHISDVLGQGMRSDQDDFLVIDADGRYVGLVRKADLLAPPRRRLVMVDHNEPGQAVPGLEDAELIEVLDHHRLGNLPTAMPIRFQVEPVGSCSTLVAEHGFDENLVFPPEIAGLLLCGILSDTLVFRSPTTTFRDRVAGEKLAVMAGLTPNATDLAAIQKAIQDLGGALLGAGAGLGTRDAAEVVATDLKYYESGGSKAGIAQVEVTHFSEIAPRLDDLKAALEKLANSEGLTLALLMVTDVVRGNSRLVTAGHPRTISALPYSRLSDDTLDAPDVVSRKKQLLPAVLTALSH
jgi:manganese-dependent inorganic pyrophosphatase